MKVLFDTNICLDIIQKRPDFYDGSRLAMLKALDRKMTLCISAVYQSLYGADVYPSLEEKAANLLYFMIKDHPFADGCKRIAASLFLEFLDTNGVLYKDGSKRISNRALVAITLMIAESRTEEKEIMVNLVMNFLV